MKFIHFYPQFKYMENSSVCYHQKLNYKVSHNFLASVTGWNKFVLTLNLICWKNNRLLTEREGRTATTEGQYSPVRPEQARLVSGLLYGTVSDSKMQWHSVSDSKMQLQKRFVTESDKSSSWF